MSWLEKWVGSKKPQTAPVVDVDGFLRQADAAIERDDWASAISLLRTVLQKDPRRLSARVNLGFCLQNSGQASEAHAEWQSVLAAQPDNLDARYLSAGLCLNRQDWHAAVTELKALVSIHPRFVPAYADLARAYFECGRHEEALSACDAGLEIAPQEALLWLGKGNVLYAKNQLDGAQHAFDQVLKLEPRQADALHNMGLIHELREDHERALGFVSRAHDLVPSSQTYLASHARLLTRCHRYEEARGVLGAALHSDPDHPDLRISLAVLEDELDRHELAISHLDSVLARHPLHAQALAQKASCLLALRRHVEAAVCAQAAVRSAPGLVQGWNLLGIAWMMTHQLTQAREALLKAVEIDPGYPHVWVQLGGVERELGDIGKAVQYFEKAIELAPKHTQAHSNRLFCMSYDGRTSPETYLRAAIESSRTLWGGVMTGSRSLPQAFNRLPDGPLRIGFVSADLCKHPVGFFLQNVLAHLDKSRVQLHAYPTVGFEDELTAQLKTHFSQWRCISGLSNERAAEVIRTDGIHLLVDLAGHSAFNRLGVFAQKPAPVQATWLGYFASTGVSGMDYIIVDRHGVMPQEQAFFSEKFAFMPDSRLCFTPPTDRPVSRLPALAKGHVTLGCFQNMTKVTPVLLDAWSRILKGLPGVRIKVIFKQAADPVIRARAMQRLADAGVDTARVEIDAALGYKAYLQSYDEVDFMLDTFPYPGGTTTCEALWMGVPTLTLSGSTLLSRQGAGMMRCAGLPQWVVTDIDEYVHRAIQLAGDLQGLAQLRSELRGQVARTALFDGALFARQLHEVFESMWLRQT